MPMESRPIMRLKQAVPFLEIVMKEKSQMAEPASNGETVIDVTISIANLIITPTIIPITMEIGIHFMTLSIKPDTPRVITIRILLLYRPLWLHLMKNAFRCLQLIQLLQGYRPPQVADDTLMPDKCQVIR